MRTAQNPNIMSRSESSRGESATIKELSVHAATTVLDTPSWTTRAKPKGISRVPTHAVRPAEAHIVRAESASEPGWHSLAAIFDDITFHRDERLPSRFEKR